MTGTKDKIADPVLDEAATWLYRLQEPSADRALQAQWQAWLTADEAHARAWALMQKAWDRAGDVGPVLTRAVPASSPGPVFSPARSGPAPHRAAGRPRLHPRLAAAALAACLGFLILAWSALPWLGADHATFAAENRLITLADGSRVQLGAGSAIRTEFTAGRRIISLLRGEAFFDVTPDAARPFLVQADDLTVTVTGTSFDVAVTARSLAVAVASGNVAVAHAGHAALPLRAGERLVIDRASGRATRATVAAEDVGAWRAGRLVVENASFADVVDALSRYHAGLILVADGVLSERRVTGVYDLGDPARALRALAAPYGNPVREVTPYLLVVSSF